MNKTSVRWRARLRVGLFASSLALVGWVGFVSPAQAQAKKGVKPAAKVKGKPTKVKPAPAKVKPAPAKVKGKPVKRSVKRPAAPPTPKKKAGAIDLGEMRVEGKLIKPEVFYVLNRETITYKDLKLKRSFVRRIIRSTRSNPF